MVLIRTFSLGRMMRPDHISCIQAQLNTVVEKLCSCDSGVPRIRARYPPRVHHTSRYLRWVKPREFSGHSQGREGSSRAAAQYYVHFYKFLYTTIGCDMAAYAPETVSARSR
jgi:hypothetical protein